MLSRHREPQFPPPRTLTAALRDLAKSGGENVTIAEIETALGDRSFSTLIVLFAAINLLPMPLGSSVVLGIPVILLTFQMLLGAKAPWLPKRIRDYSFSRSTLLRFEDRVIPWLERFEKVIKPRHWPFDRVLGERILGGVGLFMAILLWLPVPLGNWLPAFGLFLTGLALTERDGVMLALATAVNIGATVLFFSVAFSLGFIVNWLMG
ncbi:MAG: exopolysaccharide biosynthesis protein [Phyllobacteriaceae bacterium]|nr:exopolysaccharide biosynthesis protein [Phyllobacteriaceae bacterium]